MNTGIVLFLALACFSMAIAIPVEGEGPLCPCPRNMEPVCANDGSTYNNMCLFDCKRDYMQRTTGFNLKVFHQGYCAVPVAAIEERPVCACLGVKKEPLCANDGETYGNKCFFNCMRDFKLKTTGFQMEIVKEEACDAVKRPMCICSRMMAPVCANDGTTYDNQCLFECERDFQQKTTGFKLEVFHEGNCAVPVAAKEEGPVCLCLGVKKEPLCANDGRTYKNKCFFNCMRDFKLKTTGFEMKIVKEDACDPKLMKSAEEHPMCICSRMMAPVCANDGTTYDNQCLFECERDFQQKTTGFKLEVFHEGNCAVPVAAKEEGPVCLCLGVKKEPLCANDGRTYKNKCFFNCMRDFKLKTTGFEMKIIKEDACDPKLMKSAEEHPMCICSRMMAPVCANDGTTYDNQCLFECERDFQQKTTGFKLEVFHEGNCAVPVAAKEQGPVCLCLGVKKEPLCANDGKTYGNKCFFNCMRDFKLKTTGFQMEIVKEEACDAVKRPMCICSRMMAPVCANDGTTYDNQCLFECERDFQQKTTGFKLEVFHEGNCAVPVAAKEQGPVCLCLGVKKEPLCANDGKTYGNKCFFNCMRDFKLKTTGFQMEIVKEEAC